MSRDKRLITTSLAVVVIMGTSAFAESRPSNETRRRGDAGSVVRRERAAPAPRSDGSRNSTGAREGRVSERSERNGQARTYDRSDAGRQGRTYERGDRSREGRTGDRTPDGRSYDRNDRNRDGRTDDRTWSGSRNRGNGSHRGGSARGNDSYRRGGSARGNDSYRRGESRRGNDSYRGDGRYESQHRSYGNRQHYYHHGRISKYHRYGNGYRVWVIGAPYPFYVPLSHWHRDRFRIGLTIGIGGYYNPGGYYDYYDRYDRYDRYSGSRGELRGVVESIDYRANSFVVRNEATGSFVTVYSRDWGAKVRPGDFVEMDGDWRNGVFTAYDVAFIDTY